jgi:hypothetical protein
MRCFLRPVSFDMARTKDSVDFFKAGDKSVPAWMNELMFQAKCEWQEIGHPLRLVNRRFNRKPMSNVGYRQAVEALLTLADRSRTSPLSLIVFPPNNSHLLSRS